MNKSMIRYVLSWILLIEGCFMLAPCLVAVIYRDKCGLVYLIVAGAAILTGYISSRFKPEKQTIYMREGFIITGLGWCLLSFVGCLPFVITQEIPNFANALFETISGFTTTGSTILTDVEALSHTALFWRSMTHWLGGMGVLVFLLAVISMSGGSNMNLMRAESPGPTVGKLVPRMRRSAGILYKIYLAMTIILFVLLICGRMPVFDAITTAMGTAGTGGFGIKNDSIASYSPYLQWVITIFMMLFGVNFNLYYLMLLRKWKDIRKMEEVWIYWGIIGAAIAVITINIYNTAITFEENLRIAAFQVGAIVSSTGFATADFNLWPGFSRMVILFLMLCGACAGSTGGGFKVSRVVLLCKTVSKELLSYVYPKSIRTVKMDGKPVEHETVRSVTVYLAAYVLIFIVSIFVLASGNYDFTTTFTAVATTLNNIGPGLDLVGPTGNFEFFNLPSKIMLMFDMLAGRLELFPMLMLIYPLSWKKR